MLLIDGYFYSMLGETKLTKQTEYSIDHRAHQPTRATRTARLCYGVVSLLSEVLYNTVCNTRYLVCTI